MVSHPVPSLRFGAASVLGHLSRLSFVLVALTLPTEAQSVFASGTENYIFTIVKKQPVILKRWSWIVPPRYANIPWIKYLDGTTGPVDRVSIAGRQFLLGSVCWPHNCGGNSVAFLIAADGSDAYGMLRSTALHSENEIFGTPNETMRKMLAEYLSR
jgi:hypothetical protein